MSTSVSLPEPAAPGAVADRAAVEAALKAAGGPVRFAGWNLAGAELGRLDLHGCEFVRCRGGLANFSSADLTEASFCDCDLNNAKWRGARLPAARFVGCKLTGGQFQEVAALGLSFATSLLVNAYLRGLSFRRQELEGLDFSGADLAGCDFREAVLTDCSLRDANLGNARFEGADLRGADLGVLRLADAGRFKGAAISKQQAAQLLSGLGLKVF
jgi:uncharacterized protein YjbI with pentapeptide repeats